MNHPAMCKSWLLAIFILFHFTTHSFGQKESTSFHPDKKYTPEELRKDFQVLRTALEEAHPGLYTYHSKAFMQNRFDSLYHSLNGELTATDFFAQISALVAEIGCGHTPCFLSKDFQLRFEEKTCRLFPFRVKLLNHKLFVLSNFSTDSSIVAGSELISVNGVPATDIINRILPHISSDGYNQTLKYHLLEKDFAFYYAELIDQPVWFRLMLVAPGQEIGAEHTLPALYLPQLKRIQEKRYGAGSNTLPKEKPLQFYVTSDRIAYLRISSFDGGDISKAHQHFKPFVRHVFDTLRTAGINDLVIDLRNNVGGDDDYGWYLYSFLTDSPSAYRPWRDGAFVPHQRDFNTYARVRQSEEQLHAAVIAFPCTSRFFANKQSFVMSSYDGGKLSCSGKTFSVDEYKCFP